MSCCFTFYYRYIALPPIDQITLRSKVKTNLSHPVCSELAVSRDPVPHALSGTGMSPMYLPCHFLFLSNQEQHNDLRLVSLLRCVTSVLQWNKLYSPLALTLFPVIVICLFVSVVFLMFVCCMRSFTQVTGMVVDSTNAATNTLVPSSLPTPDASVRQARSKSCRQSTSPFEQTVCGHLGATFLKPTSCRNIMSSALHFFQVFLHLSRCNPWDYVLEFPTALVEYMHLENDLYIRNHIYIYIYICIHITGGERHHSPLTPFCLLSLLANTHLPHLSAPIDTPYPLVKPFQIIMPYPKSNWS